MRILLGIGAFIADFLGSSTIYGSMNTKIIANVFLPLGALLSLYLGIVTWKQKGEVLSYATLLATAGIAGAVFGVALIVLVLD